MSKAWRWARMAALLIWAVLLMVMAIKWLSERHYLAALVATCFAGVLSQRAEEVFHE